MYAIKSCNEDFIVSENLPLIPPKGGEIKLYHLTKSGVSTFDAIAHITKCFNLPNGSLSYAGLKDEDGVTAQFLTDRSGSLPKSKRFILSEGYIELDYLYNTCSMLEPGQVLSNDFEVIIREVNPDKLVIPSEFIFLNYYGLQRFGFPDENKDSHLLGKFLLDENYLGLNEYLIQSGGYRLHPYLKSGGKCSARVNFLKSSYSSFLWNSRLSDLVKTQNSGYTEEIIEGMSYCYNRGERLAPETLTYKSYKVDSCGSDVTFLKERNSQVLVRSITHELCETDSIYLKLKFSLPTGSYATVFIDQLMKASKELCEF